MLEEGSRRLPGGSGSVRREADEDSIGRGEPDHASRIRSGSATPSGNRPNVSQIASRQNSRASYGADGSSYANLQSLGPSAIRTELEDLLKELLPETLAGPVSLIGLPKKIGEGGQFYVYQQEVAFLDRNICNGSIVAVKRPIIRKSDQNPDAPIDLADPKVQESLGHIRHEIKALRNKRLRHNPNIVRLLSWAFGEEWDRPFVLVLELAYEDLANALKKKGNHAPSDLLKVRFCSDIANGLEAIHAEKIVHGDLKPANVLIFCEEWRCVAKLADFGFSTEENVQAAGGTTDWQPPEAKSSALGDCFTYGLLVWSVLFLCGEAPPNSPDKTRKQLALSHVEAYRDRYPPQVNERIKDALKGLLEEETSQRSRRVDQIFDFASEPVNEGQKQQRRAIPMFSITSSRTAINGRFDPDQQRY
ncbi:hypothetical protein J4E81_001923 [Alternaria sp. BMP 2799]|nr:hypothetical protein J4E81_001923 [Alternaria sp. BMP 2799]